MKNHTPQYYIAYERNNGGYIASAPAIPGCTVYGKTLKQAYANIQIAIQECLEVIQEFNKAQPRETVRPELIKRFSFARPREHAKA